MACKLSTTSGAPDHPTEMELSAAEQELCDRLTTVQISLPPPEHVQPVQTQLSSISFLPNETLMHIFLHGLDDIPRSAHALPLPIAVAGVCRSWRAVALCTPELWTRVFVTFATPVNHLQTYLERSKDLEIDASLCHWPVPIRVNEVNSNVAFLESTIGTLHRHAHRLRGLSLWDVSDAVICTVTRAFLSFDTPRLTNVSVKANPTAYHHYYLLRNLYLLPFLSGRAPSIMHLEIDHFPIESFQMRSDWPFNARNLASLTLRTQECPTLGFFLPPYLIEFPALCALLRSTPNLVTLALYGPIVEPDEDFPARPQSVTLPLLKTLIIHRRYPGVRYHCELLNVLALPALQRLEIPWHDDLGVELPYEDRAAAYLLDGDGRPRFPSVKMLYLHGSVVDRMMPASTFVRAFPAVEEVVLGGGDVTMFTATLVTCVQRCVDLAESTRPLHAGGHRKLRKEGRDVLMEHAWAAVRRIVLKEPEMTTWKVWVSRFCKWLSASGHAGRVCIEIRGGAPCEGELDDQEKMAFRRGLERLERHAEVIVV